jgi:membrane protein
MRQRINRAALRRSTPMRFFHKALNDWMFEFAGLLAYYLLLATVPVFVLLIGTIGFLLKGLSPSAEANLIAALARTFPPQISSNLIAGATSDLEQSSGALLAVGLISALLFGSRLIVRMDECFTVIYRERPRRILSQNLIGLGLTALFVILAPIMFLAAAIPPFLTSEVAQVLFHAQTPGMIAQVVGFLGAYLAAFLWLLAIYLLVPSKNVGLAALLLLVYELLFPWIASELLHPGNYGETAGFLILLLSFFYYFAFLLLVGAEVNSWLAGHRETIEDLPTMLHHAIMHGELPELPADSPSVSMPPVRLNLPKEAPEPDTETPEAPPSSNGASGKKHPTEPPKLPA